MEEHRSGPAVAENQTADPSKSGMSDSQSDDDIDELFKRELSRMRQMEGVEALGESSATFGTPKSTSLSGTIPEEDTTDHTDHPNGENVGKLSPLDASSSLFESIWDWSINTYRWTRQLVAEGLGHCTRTVDLGLHSQVVALYETRCQYRSICRLVTILAANFERVLQSQQELGNEFREMSTKNEALADDFMNSADVQDKLCKNGHTLIAAMQAFVSAVGTLCDKTMVDTFWTARQLNYARIQYDALKLELEALRSSSGSSNLKSQKEATKKFEHQKQTYESLKENLQVKLKLLHGNRVSVMHQQLESFHAAIGTYYSGNQTELEAAIKQFQIQTPSNDISL